MSPSGTQVLSTFWSGLAQAVALICVVEAGAQACP